MAETFAGDLDFRFTLDGEVLVARKLQGMMQRVDNWRPALEDVGDVLTSHLHQAFTTGGAATAHGWLALSPAYARWKAKHYPGKPILTRTGALARSFEKSGAGSLYELTDHLVAVGSDRRVGSYGLARLHQYGTTRMPARKIIDLPDQTTALIVQKLREHVSWESIR